MSKLLALKRGLTFIQQHRIISFPVLTCSKRCASHVAPKRSIDPFLWAAQRKREAYRSVLINNVIGQKPQEILAYCQKFGHVQAAFSMHSMLEADKPRNFLLIEFKSPDAQSSFVNALSTEEDNKGRLYVRSAECRLITQIKGNYARHKEIPIVQQEVKDNGALLQQMIDASTLAEQMQLLESACRMDEVDIRLRFFLLSLLENIVSSLFHGTNLTAFGSIMSQLGSSHSDIDLILSQQTQKSQQDHRNRTPMRFHFMTREFMESDQGKSRMLGILGSYLRSFHPTFFGVIKILHARVPIIRFRHQSAIEIDISCTDHTAVLMSKILFYLSTHEPRFKTLLMSIKFWAKGLGITVMPSGYPTDFTLTSMLTFYLQTQAVVPPFESFTKGKTGENITLPLKWDDIFTTSNTASSDVLLVGFFEFFATFDFSNTMSILTGQCIDKWLDEDWAMKIENPLMPNLNIPRNVNSTELKTFVKLCSETAQILQESKETGTSWGISKAVELQKEEIKAQLVHLYQGVLFLIEG